MVPQPSLSFTFSTPTALETVGDRVLVGTDHGREAYIALSERKRREPSGELATLESNLARLDEAFKEAPAEHTLRFSQPVHHEGRRGLWREHEHRMRGTTAYQTSCDLLFDEKIIEITVFSSHILSEEWRGFIFEIFRSIRLKSSHDVDGSIDKLALAETKEYRA